VAAAGGARRALLVDRDARGCWVPCVVGRAHRAPDCLDTLRGRGRGGVRDSGRSRQRDGPGVIVYVGETRARHYLKRLEDLGWGRMWTERPPQQCYANEPWALDNGAYGAFLRRLPFPAETFMRRVDAVVDATIARRMQPPRLAVIPDIVAGGPASLELSRRWRSRLPAFWPWYLAVQDGIQPTDLVPADWGGLAGIFLGGSSAYKATASMWCRWAHQRGMFFHYGRASTPKKLLHAVESGADSCDSSFPLWSRDRFEWFAHCWQHGHPQQELSLA